jgi:hypothetical protein
MLSLFGKGKREIEPETPKETLLEKRKREAAELNIESQNLMKKLCYSSDWKKLFVPNNFEVDKEGKKVVLAVEFEDTLEGMVNLIDAERLLPNPFAFLVNSRKEWQTINRTIEKFGFVIQKAEDEEEGIHKI